MKNYHAPLFPDTFYHVFNHANGNEKLFRIDENYRFFFEKYFLYISPIANTYAYCLMPNHFHLLISIKPIETLTKFETLSKFDNVSDFLSKQFSNFFSSYTQSYNKMYNRMGNLFIRPFGRIPISDENYLLTVVEYIHQNPIKHNFATQIDEWKYSSFASFFTTTKTQLLRNDVIQWFGDVENMKFVHQESIDKYALEMELTY